MFSIKPIGKVQTPYNDDFAPTQTVEREEVHCEIIIDEEYIDGLKDLDRFNYIFVLSYLDRPSKGVKMSAKPPWAKGKTVGLFSSRSPRRPNPIGLHLVKLLRIEGNVIHTYGLDLFDDTPVVDIKPFIPGLDSRVDANYGWLTDVGEDATEHLLEHIRGIPHDHGHDHAHKHDVATEVKHAHEHTHTHEHPHRHDDGEHDHEHEK